MSDDGYVMVAIRTIIPSRPCLTFTYLPGAHVFTLRGRYNIHQLSIALWTSGSDEISADTVRVASIKNILKSFYESAALIYNEL